MPISQFSGPKLTTHELAAEPYSYGIFDLDQTLCKLMACENTSAKHGLPEYVLETARTGT